jgi:branched-chain amino acid transport system permease protein
MINTNTNINTNPLGLNKYQLALAAIALIVLIAAPMGLKKYGVYLLSYWMLFVIATMGLNLVLGYAGQKSLGHAAFMGIGAYGVALMQAQGVSFWLALPLSMLVCFAVGWVVGYPALRVQMHYLAFATLGFNEVLMLVIRNEEWLTGGTFGINNITRPAGFTTDNGFYYLIVLFTLAVCALMYLFLRSPWGRAFTALRDNPLRAESLGINIQRYTLMAFAIGAAIAGLSGGLLAGLVNFIEPIQFGAQQSIMMYLMVVIGGSGYFLGPVLGAAIGVVLPEWLRDFQGWYLVVFGAAVMALMVWLPGGLLSIPQTIKDKKAAKAANAARAAHAARLKAEQEATNTGASV